MDSRPDLPALETVEADYRRDLIGVLVAAAGLLYLFDWMIGSGYRAYRSYGGDNVWVVAAVVGLLPLLHGWVALRLLTLTAGWKTREEGLTTWSLLRRQFTPWSEIERVETSVDAATRGAVRRRVFRLVTRRGACPFTLFYGECLDDSRRNAQLAGSLWQYLRHRGLADGLHLPPGVESFWDRIPEELPRALVWSRVSPPRWCGWHTLLVGLVFLFLAAIAALGIQQGDPFAHAFAGWAGSMTIAMAGSLFVSLRRDWLLTGRQCAVDDQAVTAETARGTVRIPWAAVTDARWQLSSWDGTPGLLITGRRGDPKVLVPYDRQDEASGRLILALIRGLREAGCPQAVTVPEALRIGPHSEPGRSRAWMARPF